MDWKNSFRCRCIAAAALVAAASVGASAQLYRHPRQGWGIDFPAGWTVKADSPRGAVARAPKGLALFAVYKGRSSAADADAWDRSAPAVRRRPYEKCRETLRAPVDLRGSKALRVEFECADRVSRRPVKGWRTVLVGGGFVDEVSYEADAPDHARWRPAAEAALRSFLPSFAPDAGGG